MGRCAAWRMSATVGLLGCSLVVPGLDEPKGLPIRKVAAGTQSGIHQAEQKVVRSEPEWQALWKRHRTQGSPPKVDFSKEMALCAFLGTRPTTGYQVEIASVRQGVGKLVVTVEETAPPRGNFTGQVITYPFAIVAVRKSTAAVEWKISRK